MTDPTASARRAVRVLGAVFLLYAALVAPHEGEFWPFSIFPMFSQAGQPWTKALVRDVTADSTDWTAGTERENLPGVPVGLAAYGINRLDVSAMVDDTEHWSDDRLAVLRAALAPAFASNPAQRLLVLRTTGTPAADGVALRFEPLVLVTADTIFLNPSLPR